MLEPRRRLTSAAALVLIALLPGAVRAGELVLVEEGVSRAPIVVFENAPPLTRRAADELAEYIEKISGVRPKVIEGEPKPTPAHAIWVGYQPKLKEFFPKLDFDFKHPEEILIAANEDHLVIAGRDRWDPDHMAAEVQGKKVDGKQQEYGTVNAVYTFLQDYLGVRWLWPGELGEDILKRKTIAFAPFEYRYHPQIRSRGGVFAFSEFGRHRGYGRAHRWTRLQRLQLGSLDMEGGHGFADWWEKFHETHPEYFALQPDGTRSGFPNPRTVKLCQSNTAVWTQWLDDVAEDLKKDPNKKVFNASPNDGWASGHCVCANCRAWDHPDGEPRLFRWKGLGQEYVALSDRHVTFANHCARLLKQRYPDKEYYVMMLSYGHSRPAPIKAVPADNVIIASVANFFGRTNLKDRGSTWGTTHREQFAAWAKAARHIMWRPNTGSPAGWQQGQPDVSIAQTIKDWKFIAEKRCIGIFIDHVWEHWATQGPQYYVMAQLTWNPAKNGQAILDEYYRRAFGPAAGEMAAYWSFLEKTRQEFVNGECGYSEVYDNAFFENAYASLDRATAAVAGKRDIYGERIAFVRAGLDYTRLIVEIRALMDRYMAGGGQDAEADKKVRADWAEIEQLCKDHPYAVNWGPIRPITPRMQGLHPDHLSAKGKTAPKPRRTPTAAKPARTAKLVPADEAGWRLVFHDNFGRDTLGDHWRIVDGSWSVEDGCLRGSGTLVSARGFSDRGPAGFQRMEFDVTPDVQPVSLLKGASKAAVRVSDLSSFIQAKADAGDSTPWQTGYFFQFGGFWNQKNQIRKAGASIDLDADPEIRITPGKLHRIVVQNDKGQLSLFVNGKPVLEHHEKSSIVDDAHGHVGFYFHTTAKVRRVKVYVKPLADDLDLE